MENVHQGHRQRMRSRLENFGARTMDTYELLEMLLYNTVPLKDTNPISKRLLSRFGSLDGVFLASREELMEVEGVGARTAELILAVSEALVTCWNEKSVSTKTFENYDDLGRFLVDYYEGKTEHLIIMISFDNSMKLLSIDELMNVDYASGGVKPSVFLDTAVRRGASVVVIAHNHPFGSFLPSDGDTQTNIYIDTSLLNAGIDLIEHYVISGSRYFGMMNHRDLLFAKRPAVEKFIQSKGLVTGGK